MRIFFTMLLREIKNIKGQFITILLIIAIGVTFYTGLNNTLRNLQSASDQYFLQYRLAHLWVYFSQTPDTVLERIARVPEIAKVSGRLVQDVKLEPAEQNIIIRMITLPDFRRSVVNDVLMKTGRYFSNDKMNQCLVEEAFFEANRLKLGDSLHSIINGNTVKLKIIGTVKSPEYIYQLRDGNELFPNSRKFGIVYLKESYGRQLFNFHNSVNEAVILLKKPADSPSVQARLEKSLGNQGLKEITPRKEQLSYNTFSSEIEQLTAFGTVFPLMFLGVAALIIYLTMSRLVENQRVQIGTLKALGYHNRRILLYYLTFAIVMGAAGSVIGAILGQYFSQFMLNIYNTMYQLPIEKIRYYYDLIIPAAGLALLFGLLAGFNAAKKELRLMPAESMRPKAPKAGQRTFIERIAVLWNRCNFSWKIIIRNLFRYKKRAAFTATGIILAASLLLTALGMNDSVNYLINQQFTEMQRYDLRVNFNGPVKQAELNYINCLAPVIKTEPVVEMGIELRNGWHSKKMGLTVLPSKASLYQILDRNGHAVSLPEQGIMLPERICRLLDLKVGNPVRFRVIWPFKRSDQEHNETFVRGSVVQYVGQTAYGSMKQVNRFFKEGNIANAALLKLDDPSHEKEVVRKLSKLANVASIQSKAESIVNLRRSLNSLNQMVAVFFLAAGAMAFAVIYNITNINIHERRRELATLKVLGFTQKEIGQLIFNENIMITIAGVLVGYPSGRIFLHALMQSSVTENLSLPAALVPRSYWLTVGLMLGFTFSANLTLIQKIRSVNMVEALKSAE